MINQSTIINFLRGKYTYSLKTPLRPKQVKNMLQSVAGTISPPQTNHLQATLTRYYGAVQRDKFWFKKTLQNQKEQPVIIDGQWREQGAGTAIDIMISSNFNLWFPILMIVFGVILLVTGSASSWFVPMLCIFTGLHMWWDALQQVYEQAKTEITFLQKLVSKTEKMSLANHPIKTQTSELAIGHKESHDGSSYHF